MPGSKKLEGQDGAQVTRAYIRSLVRNHEYNSELVERIRIVLAADVSMLLEERSAR